MEGIFVIFLSIEAKGSIIIGHIIHVVEIDGFRKGHFSFTKLPILK